MFKTLKAASAANIGETGSTFGWNTMPVNQRGSILMGIIITMVVMATLGAGMVYLTTTSTYQELLANNHARAFYAAESGGRYANALIRQALAMGSQAVFESMEANVKNLTFTMGIDDQFLINNWQANLVGGSMHVTYDSTGTVGSGFLKAKIRLRYHTNPANQGSGGGAGGPGGPGGTGEPTPSLALPQPASDFDIPKPDLDIYYSPVDMSQVDIKDNPFVDSDRALNLKADYYIMGLKWYDNPSMLQLDQIRTDNGGLLNYRAQVKIKTNNDRASKFNMYNIIGISFRLDDTAGSNMTTNTTYPDTYGISFVKLPGPRDPNINASLYRNPSPPQWFVDVIYPDTTNWNLVSDNTWHVVLWKRAVDPTGPHQILAYRKLTSADWVCEMVDGYCNIKPWSTIYVDVEERIGAGSADADGFNYGASGTPVRYNVITAYLQSNSISGSLPLTPPGPYIRSTTASPQDIWWENDSANPKFQPIRWTWVGSGAIAQQSNPSWNLRGAWASGVAYAINDGVVNKGVNYICKTAHTSASDNEPGIGANWTQYWTKVTAANTVADASLTTLNYRDPPWIATPKPREIGLHIYNIQTNAQTVFYDNFYIDLSPSMPQGTSGFVDGTGELTVS